MSVTKYSALSAKLHAMSAKLLKRSDYASLASKAKLSDVLSALEAYPSFEKLLEGADISHLARDGAERLLNLTTYGDYERIYSFLDFNDKKTMGIFFRKIELTLIKTAIKTVLDEDSPPLDLGAFAPFFDKHTELDLKALRAANSLEDIIAVLPKRYSDILKTAQPGQMTLFDVDLRLDLRYFTVLWKNMHNHFDEVFGRQIDMLNLIWLYRTKSFYSVDAQEAFSYVIPIYYRLSKDDIIALVNTQSAEDYVERVNKTRYAGFFDNISSPDEIITRYWNIMYNTNRRAARINAFSLAAPLSYMFFKEVEIRNLIAVIEGVHYGVGQDAVMAKITLGQKEGED